MNEKIRIALEKIRYGLECGESIGLARTKAVGSQHTKLSNEVMATEEYCAMLNDYMVKIKKPTRYEIKNGKLSPIYVKKTPEN